MGGAHSSGKIGSVHKPVSASQAALHAPTTWPLQLTVVTSQAPWALQMPFVHKLVSPSAQATPGLGTQVLPERTSHGPHVGGHSPTDSQTPVGEQVSVVHGLSSVQVQTLPTTCTGTTPSPTSSALVATPEPLVQVVDDQVTGPAGRVSLRSQSPGVTSSSRRPAPSVVPLWVSPALVAVKAQPDSAGSPASRVPLPLASKNFSMTSGVRHWPTSVSYTHLTLPTSDLV